MAGSNPDAQHAPTPQRIRKAREQGQIPFSRDLIWAGIWIAGFSGIGWLGQSLLQSWTESVQTVWSAGPQSFLSQSRTSPEVFSEFQLVGWQLIGLLSFVGAAALLFNLLQGNVGWFPQRIVPRMSRLFEKERGINVDGFLKSVTTLLKIASLGSVSLLFIYWNRNELMMLGADSIQLTAQQATKLLAGFGLQVAIVLGIWGLVDYGTARLAWFRSLMMTDQQLRDEQRESTGNAQVQSVPMELPDRQHSPQPEGRQIDSKVNQVDEGAG